MSNRLGGKQGTAYLGTNANQPPNWTFGDRAPTQYDTNNISLGDMWLDQSTQDVWILVSLAGDTESKGSVATWSKIDSGGIGLLDSLTGNSGGPINPDGTDTINVRGDGIGITIAGDSGTSTLTASLVGGGNAAQSFPTDFSPATPIAGVLNIKSDRASINAGSSVSFIGITNTVTLNVTDLGDNTIIGRSSGNLTLTGGDNTVVGEGSAFSLTSGSDNTIIGGTAGTSLTSGSNNIIVGSAAGSALTTTSSNTLIGGIGFAGASDFLVITAGTTGVPIVHNYPGSNASTTNGGNVFLGANSGNFTLAGAPGDASNNGIGTGTLAELTSGARNNALGSFALNMLTTGSNNLAIGHEAGFNSGGGTGLVSGTFNTLIGNGAGNAYTGAESSNIIIGGAPGTIGQSNVLIIGEATGTGDEELNKAFIHGILGITPDTNDGIPVFISSDGQLGTVGTGGNTFVQTLTGDGAVVVSPLAGNITIVGDGSTAAVTASPGTQTLTISAIGGGGGTLNDLVGDDGTPVVPLAGIINVVTNNIAQGAGSSVLFSGTVANTLTLLVTDFGDNTIIGFAAGNATITGTNNTALGVSTLNALTTGSDNVCMGGSTGTLITTGSDNVIIGGAAGETLLTGSNNILVGQASGSSYTTSESSNILINAAGTVTESNALRVGSGTGTSAGQLNKAFISGIVGITPATADGVPVFIGSAGQLGTVGTGGSTFIQTLTGDGAVAVSPLAGNIFIVGDGSTAAVTASPGTQTLTISAIGGGGGTLNDLVGDDGTPVVPLAGIINVITNNIAQGAGSTVLFSAAVANTLTLEVTDTDGNTIIGLGSGNATLTGINNTVLGDSCASSLTDGSSNTLIGKSAGTVLSTGDNNTALGSFAGFALTTGGNNTLVGHNAGTALISGSSNTLCGNNAGASITTASDNTIYGESSGSGITTGSSNTIIGQFNAVTLTTGINNVIVGSDSAGDYTSSESNNIIIGREVDGVTGEANSLRIGSATGTSTGELNKTFIQGIRGITTAISNAIPVVIDSAGQLGTAGGSGVLTTLTGNSGGPISGTAGNIIVKGDGVSVNVSGDSGTSTLTISATGGSGGPAFLATTTIDYPLNTNSDQQVLFATAHFNLGSAYDAGTSTFTAPVAGFYNFSCVVGYGIDTTLSTITQGIINIVTSNFTHIIIRGNYRTMKTDDIPSFGVLILNGNVYTPLDAGDTVIVTTRVVSPVGVVAYSIVGFSGVPTTIMTSFSGMLV